MRTIQELILHGVIKVTSGPCRNYTNACTECFSHGGIRGLWIYGKYYCCNRYHGKHRKILNRLVRRTLKHAYNNVISRL